MRTSCCLNLPLPTSNIPIKPPHVSLVKNDGYWRRQCVMIGVASYCTIIGQEFDNNLVEHLDHEDIAVAQEIESKNSSSSSSSVFVSGSKWSQKSACPSWRSNSLETIVPENLPRPAARRRYEFVGSTNKDAPLLSLQEPVKHRSTKGSCFSM